MLVKKVSATADEMLGPGNRIWDQAEEEVVPLVPTPLGNQVSLYVVNSWVNRSYGLIKELKVRGLHNGQHLFFRLQWESDHGVVQITDNDVFPDGCGILFPLKGDADIMTMGSPDWPVNAWHWRADFGDQPYNVTSTGAGSAVRHVNNYLMARSQWLGSLWRVAIGRPMRVPEPILQSVVLVPGLTLKVGYAVWSGANRERAGIKAFSGQWRSANIEA